MTQEAVKAIDHALFGYSEGHRQLAATIRLPSQDMYYLGSASDLASDARIDAGKGYLTGLPLPEAKRYALIRTWPAPEMPRPGCVWSHVLLLSEEDIAAERDMSLFFALFRKPNEVERSFYSTPLLLGEDIRSVSLPARSSELEISEIIGSYYDFKPTFVTGRAGADTVEAAVAAVWSQQWPRLRMEFSFRTAELRSRRRRGRYEVEVTSSGALNHVEEPAWVAEAAADAGGTKVTPLRRFLWRYGRDMQEPRSRFRLLVETYLASDLEEPLRLAAANRVFEALPNTEDGFILKRDILGLGTTSLSIYPAVSFIDMLRLIDLHGSYDTADVEEVHHRFEKLPSAKVVEVIVFAFEGNDRLPELGEKVFDWAIARADDDLVNAEMPSALRARILVKRPDLITSRAVGRLEGQDVPRIFSPSETAEIRRVILGEAVRRNVGEAAVDLLNQDAATTALCAIGAARNNDLDPSWLTVLAKRREQILASGVFPLLATLSEITTAARLLDVPRNPSKLGKNAEAWASRWPALQRDLPTSEIIDIEAELFEFALLEASPASWSLIAKVLSELRERMNRGPLEGDAHNRLERVLPSIGYDNWDMNRRTLLALHHLQRRVSVSRHTLAAAGLSASETEFVLDGPKPPSQRKSGLLWWLYDWY